VSAGAGLAPATVLVLGASPSSEQLAAALRVAAPALTVHPFAKDLDDATLASVEVALMWRLPAGLAPRMPRLQWLSAPAAGIEKLLVPDLPATVRLSRTVDPDQALGIAQFVTAAVLREARDLARYERQQVQRDWSRHPMAAARDEVLVLGQGETGRAIAAMLGACGLQVRGWRRRDGVALAQALPGARFVVNALPLTPETEGLLDAAAFAAMDRGAVLVNIARGGHVVEADLIAALAEGRLTAAVLDVQAQEPLPPESPLWTTPGVRLTPHIAAQASLSTIVGQFLEGLAAWQQGRPLPREVDRTRGY
jgi:phosphoglycerate dehydrogenase-like enzyme